MTWQQNHCVSLKDINSNKKNTEIEMLRNYLQTKGSKRIEQQQGDILTSASERASAIRGATPPSRPMAMLNVERGNLQLINNNYWRRIRRFSLEI